MEVLHQTQMVLTEGSSPPQTGTSPPLTPLAPPMFPARHRRRTLAGLPTPRRTPPRIPAPRPLPGQWTTLHLVLLLAQQMEG